MKASRRPGSSANDLMRFAHLGALGAVAIVGGFFLGQYLDEWLDTSPLLMLGLAFAGAAGWMLIVIREAASLGGKSAPKNSPEEHREEPPDERS